MATQVVNGAMLMCTFGTAPSSMMVTPENMTNANKQPAATIMDNIPMKNIMPFAMCTTPSNPTVSAALGAPQPCIPVIAAPWAPGSPTILIKKKPALNNSCKAMCNWGGVISVTNPGQMTVNVK